MDTPQRRTGLFARASGDVRFEPELAPLSTRLSNAERVDLADRFAEVTGLHAVCGELARADDGAAQQCVEGVDVRSSFDSYRVYTAPPVNLARRPMRDTVARS